MKTLRELREDGERHLKKAGEVLGMADLLRNLTADAAKEEILPPSFAEEADAAAKELNQNYEQSKAFLHDANQLLPSAGTKAMQMMNDRLDQLLEQQTAAMVRYNSLLEKYEASESERGDV